VRKLSNKQWAGIVIVLLFIIGVAAGSGKHKTNQRASATTPTSIPATDTGVAAATSATSTRSKARHRRHARPKPKPRPHVVHVAGLVASAASAFVVQAQPAPGTCHARGSGDYSLPDPHCTPGAVNPAVTPGTIQQTICVTGWTSTVRPSESITEPEKVASMAAYGDGGPTRAYEYDHLVPLELGGALNDARNLWPEPGGVPNPKDAVENALREQVCSGQMPLRTAQHIIATNWINYSGGSSSGPTTTTTTTTPKAAAQPSTTTQNPSQGSSPSTVHPGAFCAPEGAHGVTVDGTPMVCGPASDGRNRWHSS
jgi:hypothetical protein